MLLFYTKGYHNTAVRFLHSFFIQMPLIIWFRFISLLFVWQNAGFINNSGLSDEQLTSIWNAAAQELATKPIPISTNGTNLHPADPKALTIKPKNLTVTEVPDWTIADLIKIDPLWARDSNPSHTFAVLDALNYTTVAGITHPWNKPRIYGAKSVMATVLVWEFQNVILNKLGYSTEGR